MTTEIASPLAIDAFTRFRDTSRHGQLTAALGAVREAAGHLPQQVQAAVDAATAASAALTQTVPSTEAAVHRAAVAALADAAMAGTAVDVVKAGKQVAAAGRADVEAAAAAKVANDVHAAICARAVGVAAAHGAELVESLRPSTMAAYARLDEAVAQLPANVDLDRPLRAGATVAGILVAISESMDSVARFYEIRESLMRARILPELRVDRGMKFSQVKDIHRFEDDRLLQGSPIADAGIPSKLPPRHTVEWFVALSRAGAQWWAPSPQEQDARVLAFFEDLRSQRFQEVAHESVFM